MPQRPDRTDDGGDRLFLPSFCGMRMVLAVLLVGQLLSFVLVLAPLQPVTDRWSDLGRISLFVQWVGLSSAAVLCLARPALARLSNVAAALVSWLLLLLVTAVFSELAFRLAERYYLFPVPAQGGHGEFLLRNLAISALLSAMVLRYFYVQHQWKARLQAETAARLEALQARIRPHFLFNSLNTIAALTATRPEQAEEAVQDLADMFRVTLRDSRARIRLAEEIDIAQRYLRMELLRLGERLRVDWDLKGLPMDELVPALVLQPLLENAVYHGIEPLPEGGRIQVRGRFEDGSLELEIANPVPSGRPLSGQRGHRMALENIRERLRLGCGRGARLEVAEENGHFRVRLSFRTEAALP